MLAGENVTKVDSAMLCWDLTKLGNICFQELLTSQKLESDILTKFLVSVSRRLIQLSKKKKIILNNKKQNEKIFSLALTFLINVIVNFIYNSFYIINYLVFHLKDN